jgi:F420-dependent oxidoreductase-like protein
MNAGGMQLGLHICDFTWTESQRGLGPLLAKHAKDAEEAGFARITVMDHLWQIPSIGPADDPMLEAYTTLGFLAAHTEKVFLHTLVTGVIYREPALLAKQIATLDSLSGGRIGLGIGAGWNQQEAVGLGFAFPAIPERFQRLEETIQICLQLWSDSEEPYDGAYYHLGRTLSSPRLVTRSRPYLMIGGAGERRTLRLVAQYADACNIVISSEAAQKLNVLREHCDAVGRNYDEIEKTTLIPIFPSTTSNDLARKVSEARALGFTVAYVVASDIREPGRIIDAVAPVIREFADA